MDEDKRIRAEDALRRVQAELASIRNAPGPAVQIPSSVTSHDTSGRDADTDNIRNWMNTLSLGAQRRTVSVGSSSKKVNAAFGDLGRSPGQGSKVGQNETQQSSELRRGLVHMMSELQTLASRLRAHAFVNGTSLTPYRTTTEYDPGLTTPLSFVSISMMSEYRLHSFEVSIYTWRLVCSLH